MLGFVTSSRRVSLRFGIDAPYVPAAFTAAGLVCLGLMALSPWWAITAIAFLAQAAIYLHTTLRGKRVVWSELLAAQRLRGDEQAVDLGCGRGAVLIAVAEALPRGRVHGVDLWHSKDQSGNADDVAAANARIAGVGDRVELHTADLTQLPFADASFDLVTSALAIHNIKDADARKRAVDEAWRVVRPGGRLLLADFQHTDDLHERLVELGAADVTTASLGWQYWYGGPWAATSLVSADAPGGADPPAQ
jgi:SAM-dependent methyltransferase